MSTFDRNPPLADRLRAAAQLVRERAGAATPGADPYPGGWSGFGLVPDGLHRSALYAGPAQDGYRTGLVVEVKEDCDAGCTAMTEADTRYVATFHPAVGLAVADLLDEAAAYADLMPHRGDWTLVHQASAIADQILGVPAEVALTEHLAAATA